MPHPKERMTELIVQKTKTTRGGGKRGNGREGVLSSGSSMKLRP